MCRECNQLKLANDVVSIVSKMDILEEDPQYRDNKCWKSLDLYLGSIDMSDQWDDCRLAISRELGQEEPILYDDESIPIMLDNTEKDLTFLLDLDNRKKVGLGMIHEADKVINSWFEVHRNWFWMLYVSWRVTTDDNYELKPNHAKKLNQSRINRFISDPRNENYIKWFDYRAKLWDCWHKLDNKMKEIAKSNPRVWPAYYKLLEEELLPYCTFGGEGDTPTQTKVTIKDNSEVQIDEFILPDNRVSETIDIYGDTHIQEQLLYLE